MPELPFGSDGGELKAAYHPTMRKGGKWIEYSELTDVISSVQLIATLAEPVKRHPILWKWIVLAAHSALQGAMVCNLSGNSSLGALTDKSRAKMLKFLGEGGEGDVPDDWLAPFETLLEWIQTPERLADGVLWHPTETQIRTLKMLHYLRNEFSHFKPKGWSIHSKDLPKTVLTTFANAIGTLGAREGIGAEMALDGAPAAVV